MRGSRNDLSTLQPCLNDIKATYCILICSPSSRSTETQWFMWRRMESLRRWNAQSCVTTGGYSIIMTTSMRCWKVNELIHILFGHLEHIYSKSNPFHAVNSSSVVSLSYQRWSRREGLHRMVPAGHVWVGWRVLREVWLVLCGLHEQKQAPLSQSFCPILQTRHQLQWIPQSERGTRHNVVTTKSSL